MRWRAEGCVGVSRMEGRQGRAGAGLESGRGVDGQWNSQVWTMSGRRAKAKVKAAASFSGRLNRAWPMPPNACSMPASPCAKPLPTPVLGLCRATRCCRRVAPSAHTVNALRYFPYNTPAPATRGSHCGALYSSSPYLLTPWTREGESLLASRGTVQHSPTGRTRLMTLQTFEQHQICPGKPTWPLSVLG